MLALQMLLKLLRIGPQRIAVRRSFLMSVGRFWRGHAMLLLLSEK
jgi:hypothetical protein